MRTLTLAFVLLAACGAAVPITTPADALGKPRNAPDAADVAPVDGSAVDAPQEASAEVSAPDVVSVPDEGGDAPLEVAVDVTPIVDAPADIPQESACASMTAGNCCGVACATGEHGAAPSCVAGRCVLACVMGWGNCDGNDANGCEVDLSRVTAHCGACGAPCASGRVCSEGACATSCRAGLRMCPDGCRDLMREVANCGSCGRVCGRVCVDGRCV